MAQSVVESGEVSTPEAVSGVELAGVVRVLGSRRVLDGVDLCVPRQGRLGIVGRSGVGKSTLLSVVAGLDEPEEGTVSVLGESSACGRLARDARPSRDRLRERVGQEPCT